MKLSFSTLGCPQWTWNEILDNAAHYGFNAIEVRGIGDTLENGKLVPFLPEHVVATKEALRQRGLSLCCLGTSVVLHDAKRRPAMLQEGKDSIDVCRRMGIPYLRVFGDQVDPAAPRESIRYVAEGIDRLCKMAVPAGVTVLLEVHGTFNTVEAIAPLLRDVASHNFGILWDIEHSDRGCGDDFMPFFRLIADKVRHVHIRDGIRTAQGHTLCALGEGDIPIANIVKTLCDNGYDGFFSFEWEKRWQPALAEPETVFPQYVQWMRKLI